VLVPVAPPAGLDLEVVVGHVLLYLVAAVLPSVANMAGAIEAGFISPTEIICRAGR
jgi:hypothetical protein